MPETTDGRPTPRLHIVSHPLVQHKLTQMRRVETPSERFRQLLTETSLLLTYEVTRELPLGTVQIQTPLTTTEAPELIEEPVVVSILRAGNGLLDGVLRVLPSARVGFVGLYRDHETRDVGDVGHHDRPHLVRDLPESLEVNDPQAPLMAPAAMSYRDSAAFGPARPLL